MAEKGCQTAFLRRGQGRYQERQEARGLLGGLWSSVQALVPLQGKQDKGLLRVRVRVTVRVSLLLFLGGSFSWTSSLALFQLEEEVYLRLGLSSS